MSCIIDVSVHALITVCALISRILSFSDFRILIFVDGLI